MKIFLLFMLFLVFINGCKSQPISDNDILNYRFERSKESSDLSVSLGKKVMVSFDGVTFSAAMSALSSEYNIPIVWAKNLDNEVVFGTFSDVSILAVLRMISRRFGASVSDVGGIYYVGNIEQYDRAFAVVRIPPVNRVEFSTAISNSLASNGSVSIVGGCIWISADLETLQKVINAVESLRSRTDRSYIAEVYFIRVNESKFVNFEAQLQFNHIDIFSSSFNVNQLFSMFVNGDASIGVGKVIQQPILYLSEGRKASFSDGRQIVRERSSMSDTGVSTPTNYSTFSDGTQLNLMLYRCGDGLYSVDFDLSVSTFDRNDKSSVPASDKSELKSEGVLVRDGQVYYIGSLRRDNFRGGGGLFSLNGSDSHDITTIWLRVRELKR
jgi:type II secretory pathway component GspD/PulD (secretin)